MYFELIFPTEITCVPYCFEGRNHIFIYFSLKPSANLLCSNCAHIYTDDFIDKQQQQMQQFMQMNANMMQQHQQQTLALMELMRKFADK